MSRGCRSDTLQRQSAGATDTDCDDPVTDPASADAEKTLPKCGPGRDSQSVSEQIMTLLGAYRERQCGPLEQPGPDGTCSGGRDIQSGEARLWYGYGDVIGLIPCDRRDCDPQHNP